MCVKFRRIPRVSFSHFLVVLNFVAYTFAPPVLITPLGALSVIVGYVHNHSSSGAQSNGRYRAILASFFLNEKLGHLGRVGCALCLLGSLIIVLHAPPDREIQTVDEILYFAAKPGAFYSPLASSLCKREYLAGFLTYSFVVLVFSLVMVYAVVPRYGHTNPIIYISICSLVGSVSVMAIKGLGVAVKLTFSGNNQFTRPATYVFGILVATCIVVQTNYFNKALDTFSTNV